MQHAHRFAELDEQVRRRWDRFVTRDEGYYQQLLGLVIEELRVDYCRMRLPYRPTLEQAGGVVHGGAIASLLDTVVVPAVGQAYPSRTRFATVDLHVQYLGALIGEDAIAEGWVVKRGRATVFCESVAVGATSGKTIARCLTTYQVSLGDGAAKP